MNIIKSILVRFVAIRLSLRWIPKLCLGDLVRFDNKKWVLVQGRCDPYWDLSLFGSNEYQHVHEKDFRKIMTPNNLLGSFTHGYQFYMSYWSSIWKSESIRSLFMSIISGKVKKGPSR